VLCLVELITRAGWSGEKESSFLMAEADEQTGHGYVSDNWAIATIQQCAKVVVLPQAKQKAA